MIFAETLGAAMTGPVCPYCGAALKRAPQRKTKCPACRQSIFVEQTPDDRHKRLMTASQAADAEALWQAHYQNARIAEFCRLWRIDESSLRREVHASGGNVDAVMEQNLRFIVCDDPDLQRRKLAAFTLAGIEGHRGGDFVLWLREAQRLNLMRLPRQVFKRVKIVAGFKDHRCKRCQQFAGRILTIEQALEELPVPDPRCDATSFDGRAGYCLCHYAPVIESLRA